MSDSPRNPTKSTSESFFVVIEETTVGRVFKVVDMWRGLDYSKESTGDWINDQEALNSVTKAWYNRHENAKNRWD